MRSRVPARILLLCVLAAATTRGQQLTTGYQFALFREYLSGYAMLLDLYGPLGFYGNFYGIGSTRYPDYLEVWPGDELAFSIDYQYWGALSGGITLRLFPGLYLYGGYCNGRQISIREYTWYDPTYTLSYDGFYSTQERSVQHHPGADFGLQILPLSHLGIVLGYNTSLNALVIGINTGIVF
ncbi:MAG: hypothetical protein PHC77_06735 [Candidatus Marinimicrobia bacterium]|nr:hypothetical protein [Candidatus Neomarinimicrobiota bacterium]